MKLRLATVILAIVIATLGIGLSSTPALAMSQIIVGGYPDTISKTAQEYICLMGGYSWQTTIEPATQLIPTAGKLSRLSIELSGVPGTNPAVFTVYIDGVATSLSVSIAAGDTTGFDTDEVDVTAGQTVSLAQVHGAHFDNTPTARWSCMFAGTTANESVILGAGGSDTGANRYAPLAFNTYNTSTATEAYTYSIIPTNGYIKKLYVKLYSDPGTAPDAYTYKLRVNGGDSNDGSGNPLAVTIVADNLTGNDTTHSIDVAPGDYVNMAIIPVDTPSNASPAWWGMVFLADTDGESLILGQSTDSPTNSQTEYNVLQTGTRSLAWGTTEYFQGGQAPTGNMVLKNLYIKLQNAPGAAPDDLTFTVRGGITLA